MQYIYLNTEIVYFNGHLDRLRFCSAQ